MGNDNVTKVLGNNFHMTAPIEKIDKEQRRVSGWASLDNMDLHGDVILASANQKAFENFRGNIREQHTDLAVGKMIDFKEDTYFDPKTNEMYNGIFVTVYVSRGAQDTWEKVLDGTLTGFSIGGNIVKAQSKIMKDVSNKDVSVRIIEDYALYELSLVDNPANQMANIFAIQKKIDGTDVMTGILAETNATNVFYCNSDGLTKVSDHSSSECPVCENLMENIGWFEYSDDADKTDKIKNAISTNINKSLEGGVEKMQEEVTTEEVAPVEAEVSEEAVVVEETDAEVTPVEAEAVEEEVVDDGKVSKAIDSLRDLITETFAENKADLGKAVDGITETVSTIDDRLTKSVNELEEKHAEMNARFATIKDSIAGVEKSIDTLNGTTAIKKSGDLGGSSEVVRKGKPASRWGGAFLGDLDD